MKESFLKTIALILSVLLLLPTFAGCGQQIGQGPSIPNEPDAPNTPDDTEDDNETSNGNCDHKNNIIHSLAKKPTCTEEGQVEFWFCDNCGKFYSDKNCTTQISGNSVVLSKIGHTEVIDNEIIPTYTTTGLSRGSHCSVCGIVIIPQEVTGPLTKDEYSIQYVCDMVPVVDGIPQMIPNDTYKPSETKTLYAPKMDTYKFLGWSDKDGKMYGLEIPRGTVKDLVLYANWASDRNKAEPVSKLDDPIICEDSDAGQIIFVYEIGKIKNIPLFETQDLLVTNGIITSQGTVKQTSISNSNAEEIGKTIANTTTNSSTWTFSSDWNNVMSVSKEWAEQQGMTIEEAEEFCKNNSNNYNVVNSSGGSSSLVKSENSYFRVTGNQSHSSSTYDDEQRYAGLHVDGKLSNTTTVSAGVSAGITMPLGPAVANAKAEANASNTTAFEIGAEYDQKKYTQSVKAGTDSWQNSVDISNSNSQTSTSQKTWNSTQGFNTSSSVSSSEAVSKAVSEIISQKNSNDSSYTTGGEEGESKEYASSNANEDKYSSSVTYSKAQMKITERTFTSTGNTYGSYRLVQTGSARVFAVVAYDIKNKAYYTYTYSIIDDDEYKEYLDYSYDRSFNDYETSTLPFEIPIFVNDYVNSRITSSNLQINDQGVVTKYLGTPEEEIVLIPSYYTRTNKTTGENEMIKITGIAEGLFKNNTNIIGVSLGNFINEIPASAFEGCSSLKEVICPNVMKIGDYAFKGCVSLSEFSLPNEIQSIGVEAFYGVPAIKSNAPTIEIANIVANSNAKNIVLNISNISDTDFSDLILDVGEIESFKLLGGYKEYPNLSIKSKAQNTIISGISISKSDSVPLRVSSRKLTLERVSLHGKNFALILEFDKTTLSIEGESNLQSESANSILGKSISFELYNDQTFSTIHTNGNVLIYGSVENNNGYVDNNKIISISEDKYNNYLNSKKILLNANGGTVSNNSITVQYNSKIGQLPIPTKHNYTFTGWYTSLNGGTEITPETNFTFAQDITVYAHWSPNLFTVSFNANGGSVDTQSKTVAFGNTYGTLPVPTRSNYEFLGWYSAASGGTRITESTVMSPGSNITLYAQWKATTYTLTFNANGGNVSTSAKTVSAGASFGTLPTPTKDYYKFNGWYTAPSGGSKVNETTTISGNMTLYAQWTLKTTQWSVASNLPAGAQVVNRKWTYTKTETTESSNSSLSGWTQTGSYWKQTGTGTTNYASFPSGFDKTNKYYKEFAKEPYVSYDNGTTKRVVTNSNDGYIYWHWMYNVQYANVTNRAISSKKGTFGGYAYSYFYAIKSNVNCPALDKYYCNSQGIMGYNCHSILPKSTSSTDGMGCARFFRFDCYISTYIDYQMIYTYQKITNNLESATEISNGGQISNVQEWVEYRPK